MRLGGAGSGSYASSVLRLADSNGTDYPQYGWTDGTVEHVYMGLSDAHCKGLELSIIPGMSGEPDRETLDVINPFNTQGGPRASNGTPTGGWFKTAGEYIANINTATSQPFGWFVDDHGYLAPAAANSTSYLFEELAEQGGNIYAKVSAGTQTSGTDLTTTLTGTNPATELTDDAGTVWRYVGNEATLVATTQTR